MQIDVERANSVGICFVQLTLDIGQDPLSQQGVLELSRGLRYPAHMVYCFRPCPLE